MENADLGVSIVEIGGAILDANDSFLNMIEYSREELEHGDLHWDRLTPPEYARRDMEAIKELLERGMVTPYEKEYFTKSGARVRVRRGGALLGTHDRAVSYIIALSARVEDSNANSVHQFARLL
jgi:PAS domain S-box-containing protein